MAYFPEELLHGLDIHKFRSFITGKIPFIPNTMDIEVGINTQPGYNDNPSSP
ncbi:MAG: hypothetical protein RLZZ161_1350, partial [Bacteroidota bacterium]